MSNFKLFFWWAIVRRADFQPLFQWSISLPEFANNVGGGICRHIFAPLMFHSVVYLQKIVGRPQEYLHKSPPPTGILKPLHHFVCHTYKAKSCSGPIGPPFSFGCKIDNLNATCKWTEPVVILPTCAVDATTFTDTAWYRCFKKKDYNRLCPSACSIQIVNFTSSKNKAQWYLSSHSGSNWLHRY